MVARRKTEPEEPIRRRRPATTPEAKENEMISLAHDLAEKQLRDGSASAQVVTHFLKLGSSREKLEQERIHLENNLLEAKAEALAAAQRVEELYMEALNAMRSYSGQNPMPSAEDYDD